MTTKRSDTTFDLCQFSYSDGRYCGLPAVPGFNGLCRSHGEHEKRRHRPPVEYNEDLTGFIDPFTSDPPAEDEVRTALGRVFRALATNRISTRRAATLGYLGQLLLMKPGTSKENRENLNNLSRLLLKTLDLSYNPKFGSEGTRAAFRAKLSADSGAPASSESLPTKN